MAYDRKKIFEQAKEVSLTDGCNSLKDKFKNEKEFTENLDFDLIINNKEKTAFWLNEFKNGI